MHALIGFSSAQVRVQLPDKGGKHRYMTLILLYNVLLTKNMTLNEPTVISSSVALCTT
jgi:hypothetical protein